VLKEGARGWLSPRYNCLLTAQKSWLGVPLHKYRTYPKLLKINSEKLMEKLLKDTNRRYFFSETTNSLIYYYLIMLD
jgi:hypothetical protein